MKIIDQTPFYKENGELGLMDRLRAIMEFGPDWIKEIEGQKPVIAVLEKAMDKNFTLLRNVTPPGLGIMIPLILVGPTGVYMMSINHRTGTFSARGDQWGGISRGTLRPEKPNLLTRTERMARAIQLYLQHQGYSDLNGVEAVLLCSDPATNVDSVRPIIRVVMRDALERFAVSIAQGRLVFNPEQAFRIVNSLLNPPASPQPKPLETAAADQEQTDAILPDSALTGPGSSSAYDVLPPPPVYAIPPMAPHVDSPQIQPQVRRRNAMTRSQWAFLIIMAVIWIILLAVLAFLIARDFLPQISLF